MYQVVWNEITSLGPAWSDLCDLSLSAAERQVAVAGMKRPAPVDLNLQPPAHRGPALLVKLNAIVAAMNVPSAPVDKGKVKDSINVDEDAIMAH